METPRNHNHLNVVEEGDENIFTMKKPDSQQESLKDQMLFQAKILDIFSEPRRSSEFDRSYDRSVE